MVDCSQMLGVHYDPVVEVDFSQHVLLWAAIIGRRTCVACLPNVKFLNVCIQ